LEFSFLGTGFGLFTSVQKSNSDTDRGQEGGDSCFIRNANADDDQNGIKGMAKDINHNGMKR
jgi:hypothetical protein